MQPRHSWQEEGCTGGLGGRLYRLTMSLQTAATHGSNITNLHTEALPMIKAELVGQMQASELHRVYHA